MGFQPTVGNHPQFEEGDRVYSHYVGKWGVIDKILHTDTGMTHGVTGEPLPGTTWYQVIFDDGSSDMLDDSHGNWDMARIIPPRIARRYGYGSDPWERSHVQ